MCSASVKLARANSCPQLASPPVALVDYSATTAPSCSPGLGSVGGWSCLGGVRFFECQPLPPPPSPPASLRMRQKFCLFCNVKLCHRMNELRHIIAPAILRFCIEMDGTKRERGEGRRGGRGGRPFKNYYCIDADGW